MLDPRHAKLADVLVGYSTEVGPGHSVVIETVGHGAPLAREVYRAALRAGGHPDATLSLDEVEETLLRDAGDEQLEWIAPDLEWKVDQADAWVVIEGPRNTRRLSGVDPARMARRAKARQGVQSRYLERSAAGEFRWVICGYPTEAAAQDAGMSLRQYEDVLYRAAFLDREDPVGAWKEFGEHLEAVGTLLAGKRELRIVGEDTDLRLRVDGRTWIASRGLRNFPDGEVFTGPIEGSADGTISFTFPAILRGRHAEGVRLRFEGGEVVEATATRGQEFLREMIGLDDGARRIGELAFGMNPAIDEYTGNVLLDEKIGGTIHLALGRSVPGTGGENESGLHWDIVCDLRDGGEAYADGELVYRDGAFLS